MPSSLAPESPNLRPAQADNYGPSGTAAGTFNLGPRTGNRAVWRVGPRRIVSNVHLQTWGMDRVSHDFCAASSVPVARSVRRGDSHGAFSHSRMAAGRVPIALGMGHRYQSVHCRNSSGGLCRMVRTTAARRLLARTWKGPQTSRAVSDSFHDGESCSRIHIGHVPVPDRAGSVRTSNEC